MTKVQNENHKKKKKKEFNDDGDGDDDDDTTELSAADRRLVRKGMEESSRKNRMLNPTHLMSHEKRKELLGIKDREYDCTVIQIELPKNPNTSSSSAFVIEAKFHPREGIDKIV